MLAAVRRSRILDEVRHAGSVRVSDLTELLGVSDMTIRRDLDALDARGLLAKVHGGATAVETTSAVEPGFEAKSVRERAEKEAIGARAAALVHPGMAVGLTAGTTTWVLTRYLLDIADLTVVTNSLKVADVLHSAPRGDRTVVLTGGMRTPSDGLVGPVAVQSLHSLHVDLVLVGAHGIDPIAGLTTPNLLEAETNRAFTDVAGRVVVVADHTKWGVIGFAQFGSLQSVSVLVTDSGIPADAAAALREEVGELVTVPVPGAESG